jgi:pyruvate dehydrogenase E1 component alpha subunit
MCFIRQFEFRVKRAYDEKYIKMPVYLSVGQESAAAALSYAFPKACIFAQHRAHDLYLAYGGDPRALVDELLHRPSGCAGGMGGSASIHSPAIGMFGHSGLLGDQVPIATGFAQGSRRNTLCVMGDATAEEDYALSSLGYAAHNKLPLLFVCMDNDLSILTKVGVRRSWNAAEVAAAFGLASVDIADDPWVIMHHARHLTSGLPAFMNIRVVRHLWHAGTGKDSEPEWDRFALVRNELVRLGYGIGVSEIERRSSAAADSVWDVALAEK